MQADAKSDNIAYVLPTLDTGGAELQTVNQLNYLHQSGHNVFLIICTKRAELRPELKIPDENILIIDDFYNKQFNYLSVSSIVFGWLILPKISSFLKKNHINKVLAVMEPATYFLRLLKLFRWLFLVPKFTLVCYYRDVNYDTSPLDTFAKRLFNTLHAKLAYLTDDKTILISHAVKENISKNFYLRNPKIIFNSLPYCEVLKTEGEEYLESEKIRNSEYLIVLPGRLDKKKGHLFFIRSFKDFLRDRGLGSEQIKVIIAGGGDLYEEITAEIDSLKLSEYFHLTGGIPNKLMLSLISLSNLVVIPSIHEGFGNVAIEALMQGTLVLASDSGGLKEIIDDGRNGYLFPSQNGYELKSKLNFLYSNRNNMLIAKSSIINDYKNRFTLDSQIKKILAHL